PLFCIVSRLGLTQNHARHDLLRWSQFSDALVRACARIFSGLILRAYFVGARHVGERRSSRRSVWPSAYGCKSICGPGWSTVDAGTAERCVDCAAGYAAADVWSRTIRGRSPLGSTSYC